jgi:hypothetical protein
MHAIGNSKIPLFITITLCLLAPCAGLQAAATFDYVEGNPFDAAGIGATMTAMDGTTAITQETVDIVGLDGSRASEGKGHKTNVSGSSINTMGVNSEGSDSPGDFEPNEGWVFTFDKSVYLDTIIMSSLYAGDQMTISSDAFADIVINGAASTTTYTLNRTFVSAGTPITIKNSGASGSFRINELIVEAVVDPQSIGVYLITAIQRCDTHEG